MGAGGRSREQRNGSERCRANPKPESSKPERSPKSEIREAATAAVAGNSTSLRNLEITPQVHGQAGITYDPAADWRLSTVSARFMENSPFPPDLLTADRPSPTPAETWQVKNEAASFTRHFSAGEFEGGFDALVSAHGDREPTGIPHECKAFKHSIEAILGRFESVGGHSKLVESQRAHARPFGPRTSGFFRISDFGFRISHCSHFDCAPAAGVFEFLSFCSAAFRLYPAAAR